jgi:hypothetical protein
VPVGASAVPLRNSALEIGRGSVIAAGAAIVRDVLRLGKVAAMPFHRERVPIVIGGRLSVRPGPCSQ